MHDKRVDTKTLAHHFDEPSFSFASPEDLLRLLGVTPGSVTPFGLIFDTQHIIKVIIDRDAWNIGKFCFHPLLNTATLVIDQQGFLKFLTYTGHAFELMEIPTKVL
jgi:Ala-tRNA(Pro) deacylase